MAPPRSHTIQGRVAQTVMNRVAKDTLEKYNERYNPLESYWEIQIRGEEVKKGPKKYWKKNAWLKRDIYCPEGVSRKDAETLAHFRKWAWIFDMWFYHCTCGMTIGLGAILGLIPVVGDFADLVVGLLLIEYIKKRVAKGHKGEVLDEAQNKRFNRVLNRMRMSVLLAAGVGVIPLFGDIFDTVYKANTRNVWLLEQFLKDEAARTLVETDMVLTQPTQPMQAHHV